MSNGDGTISGQAIIRKLLVLIAVGVVFWLLWWLVGYVNMPQPFDKVARVGLAIGAVVFLIDFVLSLVGKSFINWN